MDELLKLNVVPKGLTHHNPSMSNAGIKQLIGNQINLLSANNEANTETGI